MEINNGDIEDFKNIDTDINKFDEDSDEVSAVILPSSVYKDIYSAIKVLDSISDKETIDSLNDTDKLAIGLVNAGIRFTVKQNTLVDALRKEEAKWTQTPSYADKALEIRELAMGGKSGAKGGKLRGPAAVAKFYKQLGLGGLIQVPLWHSGFWITLKPIKESELLNLEMMLANNQITLGRETNTLIFSNYSVVFVRIITEFITRHIQSSTLKLNNINEVAKHIKLQDLYILVNGLIQSIYLKGFKDVRPCIKSLELDEFNKPKCNHIITSTIDPKKLLWVDKNQLNDKHMEIMVNRSPDTVSIDQVREYQATLEVNKTKSIEIPTENNSKMFIELETPYLNKHIEQGEVWINSIIELTEKLFTEDLTLEEKNIRIKTSSKMVLLGAYNHFFKKITYEDGSFVNDRDDIDALLEGLVSDKVAFKFILKEIKTYINNNTMAIVAIPNYICPSCSTEQGSDELPKSFKDLIPINVLETFFDLSTLKTSEVSERNMD